MVDIKFLWKIYDDAYLMDSFLSKEDAAILAVYDYGWDVGAAGNEVPDATAR